MSNQVANNVIYEDITLIELVKKFAYIYDNRDYRFKEKIERKKAWRQIGAALNMGGEECENRFQNFRNRYGKERNRIAEIRQLEKREAESDWPLFNTMTFLDPFMKHRNKRRKYGNFEAEMLLQDPLLTTCELPVTKTEFLLTLSPSNSETGQSLIDHEYHCTKPATVIDPETQRIEANQNTKHRDNNNTSDGSITKQQLMSRLKKLEDAMKHDKKETVVAPADNQFQSFGRTIAFMLTSIKNKKRQRKAMADLLTRISEYDTDSDSE